MDDRIAIYAIRGDQASCPQDTIESFWSALGAGATGLSICVSKTKDNILVCSSQRHVSSLQPEMLKISELNYSELQKIDFGTIFQASNSRFNADKKNTSNYPWMHTINKKTGRSKFDALSIPTLEHVLSLFSRRAQLSFYLDDLNDSSISQSLIEDLISLLERFNIKQDSFLIATSKTCQYIKKLNIDTPCSIIHTNETTLKQTLATAKSLAIKSIYLSLELLLKNQQLNKSSINLLLNAEISIRAYCDIFPNPHSYQLLQASRIKKISIYTPSVLESLNRIKTRGLILEDCFQGTTLNRALWSAGYSSFNKETEIIQNDGLNFKMLAASLYSGAAIITRIPILGNFDACISFTVDNPDRGTTFELAAISVDPATFQINNNPLSSKSVHLSFDVHGTPPYASSERNQNNGFRCGWNNSNGLAIMDSEHKLLPVDSFEQQSRFVGNAENKKTTGKLRLIRQDSVFTSYYQDNYNSNWVNCGSMLVATLASNVFIRIAAKHWPSKPDIAPANNIKFSDFKLYQ